MALVVESVSSNSTASSGSIVVTKPTGVAVGDLLLGFLMYYDEGSSESPNTPAGWTAIQAESGFEGFNIFWRIADASDVSASNYTFSQTGGDNTIGAILRISGAPPSAAIKSSETDGSAAGIGTTISETANQTSLTNESLLVAFFGYAYNDPTGVRTSSGYNSTPSLTWTERVDNVGTIDGADNGASISIATAPILARDTTITQYGCTVSSTPDRKYFTALVLINDAQSVTADISRIDATPTILGVEASQVNVTTNVSHIEVTPTIHGIPSHAKQPTHWVNPTKPNTTYRNTPK